MDIAAGHVSGDAATHGVDSGQRNDVAKKTAAEFAILRPRSSAFAVRILEKASMAPTNRHIQRRVAPVTSIARSQMAYWTCMNQDKHVSISIIIHENGSHLTYLLD